jgi:hypothetical protein
MKVRRLKRMCAVKGCNCTDTFAITKTCEFGGVIICEECLRDAVIAIESGGIYEPEKKTKSDVPLFHHPSEDDLPLPYTAGITYSCAECGKNFKNAFALRSHMKMHQRKGAENESGKNIKPNGVSGTDGKTGNAGEGAEG